MLADEDRYVLTELARGIFSTILSTPDVEKLVVRSMKAKSHGSSVKGLAAISVDYAVCFERTLFCVSANTISRSLGRFKTLSSARLYPSTRRFSPS